LRCALFRCSDVNKHTLQTLVFTFSWAAVGCCGCCCCCSRYVNSSAALAVLVSTLREQWLHSENSVLVTRIAGAFRKHSENSHCSPRTTKHCETGRPTLTLLSKEYRHCTVRRPCLAGHIPRTVTKNDLPKCEIGSVCIGIF